MTEQQKESFLEFCKADGFDITDPVNRNQYRAVMDSVSIIPAGAGSGKTAVLAHRFLRLVMDGIHVDEILTITFTRDATSNMKSRIYGIIKKAVSRGLVDENELGRFSNAAISTTDSLCSSIVRKDCIRYGIAPDFSIDDEDNLKRESDSVADRILEKHKDDPSLGDYLTYMSTDQIKETLFCVAKDFISFDSSSSCNVSELVRERIRCYAESARECFFDGCRSYIQCFEESPKVSPTFVSNVAVVRQFVCMDDEDLMLNSGNFNISGVARKGEPELKRKYADLCLLLNSMNGKSSGILDFTQNLVSEFSDEIVSYKRKSGKLTFSDILKLSIEILRTNTDIRKYYNSVFKAVMVDEFQDNNAYNRNLVYLLCARSGYDALRIPRTEDIDMSKLFMVGDEKQSIYRFRNADVSVFKTMSRDFGENRRVSLSRNFRSEGALIDRINTMFSRIMMSTDDNSPDYEAVFCGLSSDNKRIDSPVVKFLYLEDNKKTRADFAESSIKNAMSNAQSEAYRVALEIYEAVNSNNSRYGLKDGKKPQYSDIAVLLRSSTHQSLYEKAFRSLGIPFVSQQARSLTMDSIANDFYLILYLAVYGISDMLIFAAYLRSPFCGFNDELVKKVLDNIKNGAKGDYCFDCADSLQYGNAIDSIAKVNSILSCSTLANTFSFIWNNLGYRFIVLRNSSNAPFEEHFDYLFSIAVSFDRDGRNITDFLSYIKPMLGGECKVNDIAVQREKTDGVTITSVHKSKGLEFPVVFVPDMASSGGAGGFRTDIYNLDEKAVLPFAVNGDRLVNPFVVLAKDDETNKDNAETKRILYVAATRAQYHLVFSAVLEGENPGKIEDGKSVSMLKYFLKGCCSENVSDNFDSSVAELQEFTWYDRSLLENGNGNTGASDIACWYSKAADTGADFSNKHTGVTSITGCLGILPDICGTKVLPVLECDSLFNDDNNGNAKFGTLVHSLIEDYLKKNTRTDYYGDFSFSDERDSILKCAVSMRDNFINSSFFKKISGFELFSERKFCLYDGRCFVQGVIDLLCISEDEVIIADYKTDKLMNPEVHREQLKYYADAVRSIYPGRNVRAFLFYLRSGEAVESFV